MPMLTVTIPVDGERKFHISPMGDARRAAVETKELFGCKHGDVILVLADDEWQGFYVNADDLVMKPGTKTSTMAGRVIRALVEIKREAETAAV